MEADVREPLIGKSGVALDGIGRESPKTIMLEASEEEDVENYSLIRPCIGGLALNGEKRRLSVQWNYANGNKLAEVLEFQDSDASDSEEDESNPCLCCIM